MRKSLNPIIFCSILSLLTLGCLERKLLIRSDPPGAKVYLDGKFIGQTPTETSFYFYGTREVTLHKEGYEIYREKRKIEIPFYQIFPLDFVSEFLIPFTIKDHHRLQYPLKPHLPLTQKSKKELLERAKVWEKKKN